MSMHEPNRQETSTRQTNRALALKIAAIVAATIILFYTNLTQVFTYATKNEAAAYIVAVPLVFLYLAYRKGKMLRAVMPLNRDDLTRNTINTSLLAGILVSATATLLYWQHSYVYTPNEAHLTTFTIPSFHILAMPIFAAGLILIFFNPETLKQLALPIALLFFLVPPSTNTQAAALLGGFILTSAGAVIFLLASERGFKNILTKKPDTCPQCAQEAQSNRNYCRQCGRILHLANTRIHKTDIAGIALVLLIASLLLNIQPPAFTINKTPQIITQSTEITFTTPRGLEYFNILPNETNQYSLSTSTEDTIVESKGVLLALQYTYNALSNESLNDVGVGLDISSPQSSNPPPFSLTRSIQLVPPTTIQLNDSGSPITAQYFVNESTDVDSINSVLYWNVSPVFIINQTAEHTRATIELTITSPAAEAQLPEAEQQLINLATQINNYWLPTGNMPQTTALFLSQNGLDLSAATSIALIATIFYYAAETTRQRKGNLAAVSKLNNLDKEIVTTIRNTKPATFGNLIGELQKTGQTITPEKLEQKLTELENVEIIKSQISSQNNTPIQTWKA